VSLHLPLLDCDGHIAVNYLFSLATFRGDQELEKILEEIDPNETRRPFFAKATRRPLSATATIPFITPPAASPLPSSLSALWARNPVLLQSYVHTNVSRSGVRGIANTALRVEWQRTQIPTKRSLQSMKHRCSVGRMGG
jgi:hypothetical protein